MWGEGAFGKFHTPHKIKCGRYFEIKDFQVSRRGHAALISKLGQLYMWGQNEAGQLGLGDYDAKKAPQKVK